eukprot:CAMPEP_0178998688 /NCGR_PEP_ID=MMETSP0795-20121207/9645_1 /TAXON_ID=88552 /ORGANISM="Amoebophrya sp., Strain Ameob2" /LENGTH=380 /DNA_ID=CAMNT_0020691381 /DNA_START=851 /DNA_END=1993 /DNA_ORIENTATION=-
MKFFFSGQNKPSSSSKGSAAPSSDHSSTSIAGAGGFTNYNGGTTSSNSLSPVSSKPASKTPSKDASEELMPYQKTLLNLKDPSGPTRKLFTNPPGTHGVVNTSRRNSQDAFATKDQTILVFDWDDTLFPTTWVRHYMGLHWKHPLADQRINVLQKRKIKAALDELSAEVEQFLLAALQRGRVVIVTLARIPWVRLSCDNFFPKVGKILQDFEIKIVYAQEMVHAEGELPAQIPTDPAGQEAYWTAKKQLAIQREVEAFYSQYEGQSWKNVISIGDSDFERKATHLTMSNYSQDHELRASQSRGEEDMMCLSGFVGNHYRRLRTKTVKMYDSPRIKDLELEIQLLKKWLTALVQLDSGLDVDLEDDERLAETHRLLTGELL